MTTELKPIARLDRLVGPGVVLAIVGAALYGLGAAGGGASAFFHAYLFAYICFAVLTFGCFGLSLLHHVFKAKWGVPLVRLYEAGGGWRMLVLMALLFVPILLGMDSLYGKWLHPGSDAVILAKRAYLNQPFWIARAVFYFSVFGLIAYLNETWMRAQERTGDRKYEAMRVNLSSPALGVFVILITFMFTDWVMSMEPHWYSTMYGVWFISGMALAGLGLGALVVGTQARKRPYSDLMDTGLTKDLGNLMLTFTMFWAYISLSQYLIIWNANLPEFNVYYLTRSAGNWNVVGGTLIVFQFFVPFVLLLSPGFKRSPKTVAIAGAWMLALRVVDIYYIVVPAFQKVALPSPQGVAAYLGALLGLGGIWLAHFGWQLRSTSLVPRLEPTPKEVMEHA